jgi:hypothetical protein
VNELDQMMARKVADVVDGFAADLDTALRAAMAAGQSLAVGEVRSALTDGRVQVVRDLVFLPPGAPPPLGRAWTVYRTSEPPLAVAESIDGLKVEIAGTVDPSGKTRP